MGGGLVCRKNIGKKANIAGVLLEKKMGKGIWKHPKNLGNVVVVVFFNCETGS